MDKKIADAVNIGLGNSIDLSGNQKSFQSFDFKWKRRSGQCLKCNSDYMRFAIDGWCQNCLQRIEFIVREHPNVLKKIQLQGGRSK